MSFLYVKALHIIFVVTWFAGLFYIVRLFIYTREAQDTEEPLKSALLKQYLVMQKRLWYGITWPSALLTLIFGLNLLHFYPTIPFWLWLKLSLVGLLFLYHISCHYIFGQQSKGVFAYSSTQLRIWNEVATLFLVGIVFLVVLKDALGLFWGVVGLVGFAAMLMLAIRVYKSIRDK